MLKTGWACLLFLAFDQVSAQVFENNAGAREKHFVYEVKQIDEFFERFNDDPNSFIRREYDSYHKKFNLSREQLVRSLFNYETHSWDSVQLDEFVGTVLNVNKPLLLDFYEKGWFAEATCKFEYNATVIEIPIILRIEADASKRSKWMIAAVKHNSIRQEVQVTIVADTMKKTKFINPASHASGFIELARAFEDRAHLSDYFEKLTGITNDEVEARGVDFALAHARFAEFAGDRPICAFGHDEGILDENIRFYGLTDMAVLPEFHDLRTWFAGQSIDPRGMLSCEIGPALGVPFEGRLHNALDDARSLAASMRALLARGAPARLRPAA